MNGSGRVRQARKWNRLTGDTVSTEQRVSTTASRRGNKSILIQPLTLAAAARNGSLDGLSIVRLALAATVILSHSWPLGGFGDDPTLPGTDITLGTMAVVGFLSLSGFLVTLSLERLAAPRFMWHRVLRIMPAYWICLLLMAFVLAPTIWWFSGSPGDAYWSQDPAPASFVSTNFWLNQQQFGIGSVFAANPYGTVIDGSLWSLIYEFLCYLGLVALALTCAFRQPRGRLFAFLVASVAVWSGVVSTTYLVNDVSPAQAGGVSLPLVGEVYLIYLMPLTFAFCCGSLLALGARYVSVTYQLIIGSVVALAVGIAWPAAHYLLVVPALSVLLLVAGIAIRGRFVGWFRRNDGSYGTYLYGFPIQQTLVFAGVSTALGPFGLAALAFAFAYPLGLLSWWCIERPALRLKDIQIRSPRRRSGQPFSQTNTNSLYAKTLPTERGNGKE